MSRNRSPRRPTGHDFNRGELVIVTTTVGPCDTGDVVQVVGFRGNTLLRLLPAAGIPFLCSHEAVQRTGLAGSPKPQQHRRRYIRRKPAPAPRVDLQHS
jgi:hypothetical protein